METSSSAPNLNTLAIAVIVAGMGIVSAAFLLDPEATQSDLVSAKFLWFIAAAGIGLLIAGFAAAAGRWAFGVVACALVWGGAGQLFMTDPLWFPKIRSTPESYLDFIALTLILVQGLITVLFALRGGLVDRLAAAVRAFGLLPPIIILILSVLVSVSPAGFTPNGNWSAFTSRLVLNAALIGLDFLTIIVLLALPAPTLKLRAPVVPTAAALTFVLSAACAHFGFDRLPHVEDEVVYMLQAKIYAEGALAAPAPPEVLRPGLDYYLLDVRDGKWIATPPPGWPVILALGVLLGVPWLINPALAALCILVASNLATRLWGASAGKLTAVFLASSPWFLAIGGSLMPHMASLLMVLLCWTLLLKARDGDKASLALLAGLAMGWVFVIRQLEGAILGVMTGLWLLSYLREQRGFLRGVLYSVGCIATGAIYLLNNFFLAGHPLKAPLAVYIDGIWGPGANDYGFGDHIGPPGAWAGLDLATGHGPYEGLMNTLQNISMLDMDYLGWGCGSLLLVWAAWLYRKADRPMFAMLAICVMIAFAMFFYWFSGSFYVGPRYWFMMIFPLAAFSALGARSVLDRIVSMGVPSGQGGAVLAVLLIFSLAIFLPWRAAVKYHDYGGSTDIVRTAGIEGDALVFVDLEAVGPALMLNDPFLREGHPIFVQDLGDEVNGKAEAAFPDRKVVKISSDATIPSCRNLGVIEFSAETRCGGNQREF